MSDSVIARNEVTKQSRPKMSVIARKRSDEAIPLLFHGLNPLYQKGNMLSPPLKRGTKGDLLLLYRLWRTRALIFHFIKPSHRD